MESKVLNKAEIYRRMSRFMSDPDRIMSSAFFAELAGCSQDYLYKVFVYKNLPLSETMQIRISAALKKMQNGEVRVMRNRDNTRELHYVRNAKPVMQKACTLDIQNGKFSLKIGPKNRGDYSQASLKEKAKWQS